MKKRLSRNIALALVASGMLFVGSEAMADAFTITTQLTGDPRVGNPDNLIVDVTIMGDTTSNQTSWTVDINSPLHPDIKLDAFFFNLDVDSTLVSFSNFDPNTWFVDTTGTNAAGSGGADFVFEADSTNPTTNVTNTQDLTFLATLSSGFWNEDIFLNAGLASSNDITLGSFQVGAHLQSLVAGQGESDSGFATGYWVGGGEPPEPIPEPMTMLLFGTGLAGLAGVRLRKK